MDKTVEDFPYGFIYSIDSASTSLYFLRSDRAMYDWMVEPVEESLFINKRALVDLPEGYYLLGDCLNEPVMEDGVFQYPEGAERQVRVKQDSVVHSKAFLLVRGRENHWLTYFEAQNIPPERTFYLGEK